MTETSKKNSALYYAAYCGLYAVLAVFIFGLFFREGHSLIYHSDSWRQHIRAMTYYGKWLRGILYQVMHGDFSGIQTFAFGIGYGADVPATLHYYCVGDPIAFFSVFVPTEKMHVFFQAAIIARSFLSGLTFSMMVREIMGDNGTPGMTDMIAVLAGALTYAFCGWFLYLGLLHPFFATPMWIFPLLLLGAERVLQKNQSALFVAAVCIALLANFYFAYMEIVMTVLYVIWRLICTRKERAEKWTVIIGRFFIYGIAGVLLSMCLMLPVLMQFLQSPRGEASYRVPLFYEADFYKELIRSFATFVNHPLHDNALGFNAVALPSTLFVFGDGKKKRPVQALFLFLTLCMLFPAVNGVLNGMSFAINRWVWAYAFLVSGFVVMFVLQAGGKNGEETPRQKKRSAAVVMGGVTVYGCICLLPALRGYRTSGTHNLYWSLAIALLASLLFLFRERVRRMSSAAFPVCMLLLTVLSVGGNAYFGIAGPEGNYAGEMTELYDDETFMTALEGTEVNAVKAVEELKVAAGQSEPGTFYRYTGRNLNWNAAMTQGISSTQMEFSLANHVTNDYFMDVALNERQSHAYFGLDDRAALLALAGVKYYTLAYDNPFEYQFVPPYFVDLGIHEGYRVYENALALPLGYTYEKVYPGIITQEDWDRAVETKGSLSLPESGFLETHPLARENNMLQGVFLQHADGTEATEVRERFGSIYGGAGNMLQLVYTWEASEGITMHACESVVADGRQYFINEARFTAEKDAYLSLQTPEHSRGQALYVRLERLSYEGIHAEPPIRIAVVKDGVEVIDKTLHFMTPDNQSYSGWDDFLINLGVSEDHGAELRITFEEPGVYSIGDLAVIEQSVASFPKEIASLKEDTLEQVDLHRNPVSNATNRVTGTISLDREKILCLSIPFSKGWSATVDGEKAEVYRANRMFMGLVLDSGEHVIELQYKTPGMTAGWMLTIAGIILCVALRGLRISKGMAKASSGG